MKTTSQNIVVPCDRRRILITDDEEPVRDVFQMILANYLPDNIIDLATNGIEAVQSFGQFHQGVLLMDLKMPLMDGQTAFNKISDLCGEKGWETPAVIFFTGFAPSASVSMLAASGQNYCLLQKPVTSETLLNAVKRHLPAPCSA